MATEVAMTAVPIEDSASHPTLPIDPPPPTQPIQNDVQAANPAPQTTKSADVVTQNDTQPAKPSPNKGGEEYKPLSDDFFKTIFYFSGMGEVIGSALNEGVYVDERYRGRAVDSDELPAKLRAQFKKEEYPLVSTCREQVHGISDGVKNLRNLLDNVPTYTESQTRGAFRPSTTEPQRMDIKPDDPIHAERYYRENRRRRNYE